MANFLRNFLKKNNSIAEDKAKIVATFCTACALTYHIFIFFVFIYLKVLPMVIYNVFSIILFSVILSRIKKTDKYVILYTHCAVEVIPHQILADYFLGTFSNFHFFILLMGLIPFLVFKDKTKTLIPFALITSITFIVMENLNLEPRYETVTLQVQTILRIINVTLSVCIIFFMILIFTYIVANYERNLKETNSALANEIKLAAIIQQSFFKQDLSDIKNLEISCYNKAMAGVSGDVYDFYKTENKLDGFGLFDISGHGISSGLVTMLVKNIINKEFYEHKDLELWEIMNSINDHVISEKGNIQNYLTGILVRFNSDDEIELVSAGHPMPIIYRHKTRKCELLKQNPKSVGAIGLEGLPVFYNSIFEKLNKNDEIILYSDGIIDTLNEENQDFGIENFMKAIETCAEKTTDKQTQFIARTIETFRGNKKQTDDLTFIILKK